MATDHAYVGAVVEIELDTDTDLSGGGTAKILYRKPTGETGEWTATVDAGTDGIISYTTVAADLDVGGTWRFQAELTISGSVYLGDAVDFRVLRSFEIPE